MALKINIEKAQLDDAFQIAIDQKQRAANKYKSNSIIYEALTKEIDKLIQAKTTAEQVK